MYILNNTLIKVFESDIISNKVYIPDNVKIIGKESFKDLVNLKKIKGGKNVKRIENMSFVGSGLEEIPDFIKNIKKHNISKDCFINCYSLMLKPHRVDNIRHCILYKEQTFISKNKQFNCIFVKDKNTIIKKSNFTIIIPKK